MKILFIENDQKQTATFRNLILSNGRHDFQNVPDFEKGLREIKESTYDLVIASYLLPDMTAITFLDKLNDLEKLSKPQVIITSSFADKMTIIKCFRRGIRDFLPQPVEVGYLMKIIDDIENEKGSSGSMREADSDSCKIDAGPGFDDLSTVNLGKLGEVGFFSPEMKNIKEYAIKLHDHENTMVLIQGETGTGKEIIARLIHFGLDKKTAAKPFICLNCSAISPNLFESELFGYEGGAFTGADPKGKKGKLELAGEGTIFLDEIGDMPVEFQPKLLRALQERKFYRISGTQEISLRARVICATNSNLLQLVEDRKFRRDLYYRLNSADIQIPPLRDRKSDIVPLAKLFMKKFRPLNSRKFAIITEEAKQLLQNLQWKGNVRELHTAIERIAFRFNDTYLQTAHIESVVDERMESRRSFFNLDLPEEGIELDEAIRLLVLKILHIYDNNISATAKYLGTTRNRIKRITGQ